MRFRYLRIAWSVGAANGYRSASPLAMCATLLFAGLIVANVLAALSIFGRYFIGCVLHQSEDSRTTPAS